MAMVYQTSNIYLPEGRDIYCNPTSEYIGIKGLCPNSDKIVNSFCKNPQIVGEIGSPPNHILGLFNPSIRSEQFIQSLSIVNTANQGRSDKKIAVVKSNTEPKRAKSQKEKENEFIINNNNNNKNNSNSKQKRTNKKKNKQNPSRTLFVRNINNSATEQELEELFGEYGEIKKIYAQSKNRGFVMVTYYDIRHSNLAMKQLQNKVFKKRKLDIHYSIPKSSKASNKNHGTLVVFNLNSSLNNQDLSSIFGSFGEIKDIRHTPNKTSHRFIEFFDSRHALTAMKALNKKKIHNKIIKIEMGRPGGKKINNNNSKRSRSYSHPSFSSSDSNSYFSSKISDNPKAKSTSKPNHQKISSRKRSKSSNL
eukprot:TRINITY_DN1204_c0_g2_i1.p1 TRINITY_DN1204_c0_g2~~TRINITY_DN1204_c0_g2_i1.p1  ORF type:complete len:364 (+),score=84.74 TRINITY_DN1204_c0_g2_i1:281-1372(+)